MRTVSLCPMIDNSMKRGSEAWHVCKLRRRNRLGVGVQFCSDHPNALAALPKSYYTTFVLKGDNSNLLRFISMSDHTSSARQIAEEKACSMSTVNAKAKALGIKFKGRSPNDHERLLEVLKSVRPRKKVAPPASYDPKASKAVRVAKKGGVKRRRRKAIAKPEAPGADVQSFLKQAKDYIVVVKRRLVEVDKQKAELEGLLERLVMLNPGKGE